MTVKGVQITTRDREVFCLLQRFPLLSAEGIHKACFDSATYSAVGRRLKKLVDYELLKRLSLLDEPHYRYYITESARPYLDNDRPLKRINRTHLRHDVELYQSLLGIERMYGDAVTIIPDFELRFFARRNYRTTLEYEGYLQAFQLSFLPDALIVHKDIGYFLEYDRSTIWGVNLFKKLSAYQQYFTTEKPSQYDHVTFRDLKVIFLCQSQSRVDALIAATGQYTKLDVFQFFDLKSWAEKLKQSDVFLP